MFDTYHSSKKLKQLSASADDIIVTSERIATMKAQACGLSLFYATENVDDEILATLAKLAEEAGAVKKMRAMQNGDVINNIEDYPSEERSVLHTAMRDFFENKNTHPPAQEAAKLAWNEIVKLQTFMEELDTTDEFSDIIMIGIGGSALGPYALCEALKAYRLPGRRMHLISNVDPDSAIEVLREIDPKRTMVVVVSKSGTTLETCANEAFVLDRFVKASLPINSHFVAVTGKNSPMDNPEKYRQSFYIWDYVGGRYSSTSMVGGVVISFLIGFRNFLDLLRGASDMDAIACNNDIFANLPLLSALLGIWNRNFLNYPTVAVIPYSQPLHRFTAHLQQCDMESNGKSIDTKGRCVSYSTAPIIWGEPGTDAQHSFFQLLHQGTDTVSVEFIGFLDSQYGEDITIAETNSQQKLIANLFAQMLAFSLGQDSDNPNKVFSGKRPSRLLLGKKLDPYIMGVLLAYYEHKIAFQGFIWGINSFDQEGVQLGKVLAKKFLTIFSEGNTGEFPLGEAFLSQLDLTHE